eukprot:Blabericola_migrator_1__2099@NODE_157_length_12604_cov_91_609237_g137_i0_p1_GENE_NODE_157_length_12604_cov_91_609237_g137_i0NODE_157_length_12604_cov_91_609237_g137_i0_p1_ORF_typecomplete_len1049_score135_16LRR_4/PF12799_7/1_2e07LRR_4/PF12799_7/0_00066LRR_9/PF14580_6/3_4e12LRR_8/PF13855_6/0_002LRR_8/PF13855_6/0_026LRR_6/PF13516_6/3_6LRR_6/PF13516_6/0_096LRR_6/PF13516_6/1_4e02LRR_1/PF00560_33/2e02LRR_1/PF00560_33/1_5LRR_1/PF00560_33/54_NODE_157_length_12604_cov_91_609237_g137_i064499595
MATVAMQGKDCSSADKSSRSFLAALTRKSGRRRKYGSTDRRSMDTAIRRTSTIRSDQMVNKIEPYEVSPGMKVSSFCAALDSAQSNEWNSVALSSSDHPLPNPAVFQNSHQFPESRVEEGPNSVQYVKTGGSDQSETSGRRYTDIMSTNPRATPTKQGTIMSQQDEASLIASLEQRYSTSISQITSLTDDAVDPMDFLSCRSLLLQMKELSSVDFTSYCFHNVILQSQKFSATLCGGDPINDLLSNLSLLSNLKMLRLAATSITSLKFLAKLPQLEYCDLSHNKISDLTDLAVECAVINTGASLNLRHLDLRWNLISDKTDLALPRLHQHLGKLKILDLTGCPIVTSVEGPSGSRGAQFFDLAYEITRPFLKQVDIFCGATLDKTPTDDDSPRPGGSSHINSPMMNSTSLPLAPDFWKNLNPIASPRNSVDKQFFSFSPSQQSSLPAKTSPRKPPLPSTVEAPREPTLPSFGGPLQLPEIGGAHALPRRLSHGLPRVATDTSTKESLTLETPVTPPMLRPTAGEEPSPVHAGGSNERMCKPARSLLAARASPSGKSEAGASPVSCSTRASYEAAVTESTLEAGVLRNLRLPDTQEITRVAPRRVLRDQPDASMLEAAVKEQADRPVSLMGVELPVESLRKAKQFVYEDPSAKSKASPKIPKYKPPKNNSPWKRENVFFEYPPDAKLPTTTSPPCTVELMRAQEEFPTLEEIQEVSHLLGETLDQCTEVEDEIKQAYDYMAEIRGELIRSLTEFSKLRTTYFACLRRLGVAYANHKLSASTPLSAPSSSLGFHHSSAFAETPQSSPQLATGFESNVFVQLGLTISERSETISRGLILYVKSLSRFDNNHPITQSLQSQGGRATDFFTAPPAAAAASDMTQDDAVNTIASWCLQHKSAEIFTSYLGTQFFSDFISIQRGGGPSNVMAYVGNVLKSHLPTQDFIASEDRYIDALADLERAVLDFIQQHRTNAPCCATEVSTSNNTYGRRSINLAAADDSDGSFKGAPFTVHQLVDVSAAQMSPANTRKHIPLFCRPQSDFVTAILCAFLGC